MTENGNIFRPLLEISLLGKFRVKIDGIPVDEKRWTRRSAKALIKLLALKSFHTVHREQAADLLWAEESSETALNNLHKAIHQARRALEPDLAKGSSSEFILTQKQQIILASPGSLLIDLDEFERFANYALQKNDLEAGQKAFNLYQGDLLVEDIYEDWIYTRRESSRILYRKVATKIAEIHAAKNEQAASIEILKRLVAEDATDEYAQRLLMLFYAETGSKFQALKQFEQCRAALHNLGIEPEPETLKLEQRIKRGEIIRAEKEIKPTQIISPPHIRQLTFQNGAIKSARFLPDGKTIVFSADWDDGVPELYTMCLENGLIQSAGIKNAHILSIASNGQMAVALNPKHSGFIGTSVLAKMNLGDGEQQEILRDVIWAEWRPSKNGVSLNSDGKFLAVVRDRNGKSCLEFPVGNVIYETDGWFNRPRFSSDGKKIAFIEHPLWGDDRGFIVCLDLENESSIEKKTLTATLPSIQGLAWHNNQIWFTAAHRGNARMIKKVNLAGEKHQIYRGTGRLTLHDISKDGKLLVVDDKMRVQSVVRRERDTIERDLSWHDWTLPRGVTDDGQIMLFEEAGVSGGNQFAAYIRNTDGTSTKKLADASAMALSPDGKHALLRFQDSHNYLALVSIENGEIKPLETDPKNPLTYDVLASFFPDGKRIMFAANDPAGKKHIYTQEIDGGMPVRFKTAESGVKMLSTHTISPDGRYTVLNNSEKRLVLYRISDGTSFHLKNLDEEFYLIRWAGDGENLFIWQRGEMPAIVYKYNLATGNKEKWLELMPSNTLGVIQILGIKLTPDGKTYVYTCWRELSDLYLMEGLT